MSHLRFDDETDRIAKYRLKATGGYLQTYAGQYRYPIDYTSEREREDYRNERKDAIQLKRSYPKNYQQYRLLRSRLPREPRERPAATREAARSAARESRNGLTAKELASSSSSKDAKLLNNRPDDKALINGRTAKETPSLGRESRMGGERLLSSILSSKIVSLKDNEQITASKTTIGQRINFRSELLPNLVYTNLIRRAGAMERKPEMRSEQRSEIRSEIRSDKREEIRPEIRSENVGTQSDVTGNTASGDAFGQERSINQMYIQRYSNQTVKNSNSTDLKRHLNDAVLLTNVSLQRDEYSAPNATVSSNELPSILQNTLLSGDASSIEETLLPSINTSAILNLIKNLNLTNGSNRSGLDVASASDATGLVEPTDSNAFNESSALDNGESLDELRSEPPKIDSTQVNREPTDSQQSSDLPNFSQPTRAEQSRAISSSMQMAKSTSLYSPLELQLIKLAPTMGSNLIKN